MIERQRERERGKHTDRRKTYILTDRHKNTDEPTNHAQTGEKSGQKNHISDMTLRDPSGDDMLSLGEARGDEPE